MAITLLTRREIRVTQSPEELLRIRGILERGGVRLTVRSHSLTNPGRRHGVPGIRPEAAYEYRVYVHKADYNRARELMGR